MGIKHFLKHSNVTGKPPDFTSLDQSAKSDKHPNIQLMVVLTSFSFPVGFVMLMFLTYSFDLRYQINCAVDFNFLDIWEKSYGGFFRKHYINQIPWVSQGGPNRDELGKKVEFWSNLPKEWSKLPNPPAPSKDRCDHIPNPMKFDCFPRGIVTEKLCIERGCCYQNVSEQHVPFCFYPENYRSYKYVNVTSSEQGIRALLTGQFKSPYPNDIVNLKMEVIFLSDEILYILVTDVDGKRNPFPFPEYPHYPETPPKKSLYEVKVDSNSSGFQVIRKSNKKVIFDTKDLGGFIFSDQMIQISASIPSKYVYGLGEQRNNFLLDFNWNTFTLFTHDSPPSNKVNGYGYHPFYLCMEEDGQSNGVFIHNGYPMEIVLQPGPAVTYRMIGGILGIAVVLGPSPIQVVEQYTTVIGRPTLPPYWGLGFHLSRFGYGTLDNMTAIWSQTRAAHIPFDTQWTDLDYMDNRNDFTIDNVHFKGLKTFVDHLHEVGMHYVIILDPGISGSETPGSYPPYDEGVKQKIFILDSSGKKPFQGKVWNSKSTVFPDFTNPKVVDYWLKQLSALQKKVAFDGVWLDMNEPSNFLNGSIDGCPKNELENPPYLPTVQGGLLSYKTLCMSAYNFFHMHIDVHNLYGTLESVITNFALAQVRKGKRPFVISRSTSPGIGAYAGHWTGDISSTWDDMSHSISDIMSFSLFGIPLVGADICGFNGNTTPELCARWYQLGAFYPFSRSHNTDDAIAQDPVSLGKLVVESARRALHIRYTLLPYLYTLMWEAHTQGTPVVHPLFFQFPNDKNTYSINTQFMWGKSVLIAPVLEEGITYAKVYFGKGIWYDGYNNDRIEGKGETLAWPAPLDTIPVFFRGGSVVPVQRPSTTTTLSRKQPFGIYVYLNQNNTATGKLYWDDGDTMGGPYNLIEWSVSGGQLTSKVCQWHYDTQMKVLLLTVTAVPQVTKVTVNSANVPFEYSSPNKTLTVNNLDLDLKKEFTIAWS